MTRSGMAFSPYAEPIKSHYAYRLRDRLAKEDIQRRSKEDAGFAYESDDDLDFEDPLVVEDPDSPARAEGGASIPSLPKWEGLSNKEQKKRAKKQSCRANDPSHPHVKAMTAKRCAQSIPLKTKLDPSTLPIASSGWIGSRPPKVKEEYKLEELLGPEHGMKLVNWDGWQAFYFAKTSLCH